MLRLAVLVPFHPFYSHTVNQEHQELLRNYLRNIFHYPLSHILRSLKSKGFFSLTPMVNHINMLEYLINIHEVHNAGTTRASLSGNQIA